MYKNRLIFISLTVAVITLTRCSSKNERVEFSTQIPENVVIIQTLTTINNATKVVKTTNDLAINLAIAYTIKSDDTLFSISEKFNLDPYTIIWANLPIADKLHKLPVGEIIRIPPINGFYYVWEVNDDLTEISNKFGGKVEDILKWNNEEIKGDYPDFTFDAGTEIFIPYGSPDFKSIQ